MSFWKYKIKKNGMPEPELQLAWKAMGKRGVSKVKGRC
jgi:hypothetical protein